MTKRQALEQMRFVFFFELTARLVNHLRGRREVERMFAYAFGKSFVSVTPRRRSAARARVA